MLFNSVSFIFVFLPITLLLFHLTRRYNLVLAQGALLACSLWFYAEAKPVYLLLIAVSVGVNYPLSRVLAQSRRYSLLVAGLAFNLGLLGAFKYAGFAAENINALAGFSLPVPHISLPLGISFLTFHQISYLVDVAAGRTRPSTLARFALYIAFFPHLIAGPIVRHAELMPQLTRGYRGAWTQHLAVGLTVFVLGLAKKVLLADPLSGYATPVFDAAAAGAPLEATPVALAIMAYTFQIYFDFSGYSDMAIGLARMFGLRLPVNFFAPYRARSITEFWRRWHITLSRFLRDYLYIPLGGNRKGPLRRYVNLLTVMLLGGLWHGAGWTFVIWGGLHGLALALHAAFKPLADRLAPHRARNPVWTVLSWVSTLGFVMLAWVYFRASTAAAAHHMLAALAGPWSAPDLTALLYLLVALGLVLLAPTPSQWLARYRPALAPVTPPLRWRGVALVWRPSVGWAVVMAALLMIVTSLLSRPSEFLYFRF